MISNNRRTTASPSWEHWSSSSNNKIPQPIDSLRTSSSSSPAVSRSSSPIYSPSSSYSSSTSTAVVADLRESTYQRMHLAAARKPLREFLAPLHTSDSRLYDLACAFSRVFRNLAANSGDGVDGSFSPVPVTRLPAGREIGRYLAVDVGITTLKVAFIELLGDENGLLRHRRPRSMSNVIRQVRHSRIRRTLEKAWRIEERLKQDEPHELFLWIGNCIAEVVKDDLLSNAGSNVEQPAYIETGIAFGLPIRFVFPFVSHCIIF